MNNRVNIRAFDVSKCLKQTIYSNLESRGKTSDTIWWKAIQGSTEHYRIARSAPNPDWEGLDRHLGKSDPGAGCWKMNKSLPGWEWRVEERIPLTEETYIQKQGGLSRKWRNFPRLDHGEEGHSSMRWDWDVRVRSGLQAQTHNLLHFISDD